MKALSRLSTFSMSAATTSAPSFASSFAASELTSLVSARAAKPPLTSLKMVRTKPPPCAPVAPTTAMIFLLGMRVFSVDHSDETTLTQENRASDLRRCGPPWSSEWKSGPIILLIRDAWMFLLPVSNRFLRSGSDATCSGSTSPMPPGAEASVDAVGAERGTRVQGHRRTVLPCVGVKDAALDPPPVRSLLVDVVVVGQRLSVAADRSSRRSAANTLSPLRPQTTV